MSLMDLDRNEYLSYTVWFYRHSTVDASGLTTGKPFGPFTFTWLLCLYRQKIRPEKVFLQCDPVGSYTSFGLDLKSNRKCQKRSDSIIRVSKPVSTLYHEEIIVGIITMY